MFVLLSFIVSLIVFKSGYDMRKIWSTQIIFIGVSILQKRIYSIWSVKPYQQQTPQKYELTNDRLSSLLWRYLQVNLNTIKIDFNHNGKIKLRMEMGNVPKRQQPDHRKRQQQKVTNRSSM